MHLNRKNISWPALTIAALALFFLGATLMTPGTSAQKITQLPLDIALLIDVSSSVVARFDFEQEAASRFLERVLKPEDRATVFAIDETPRLVQQLTSAAAASRSVMSIKPSNSYTAFFDSVVAATNYLDRNSSNGRRRIIVVISDGD